MTARKSEIRDGMRIDWDTPIVMDDGIVLMADVFRPIGEGRCPVLLSYGPYAKGLAFQEGYPSAWQRMVENHPDIPRGSTNKYQNWEVVDPEKWVPGGYACVRVDSRGCGGSPGFIDPFSPREAQDLYASIEWAGAQDWSNGKVGLNGISYYAMNQWQVASLQPPHLAAMCIWEGASDWYREVTHHGGILSTFGANWYDMQVKSVQHGLGARGPKSRVTGEPACGFETLSEGELARNRCDLGHDFLSHPFDDDYYKSRAPQWDKVKTPFLSAANWGGQPLHTRGNIEGFVRAAAPLRWLECHGGEHWTSFYTDYGVGLQKRFFDHFLKGEQNGWDKEPRVRLQVRGIDGFEERFEEDWPIPRTIWTRFYLDLDEGALVREPPRSAQTAPYEAMGRGLTFYSAPLAEATEVTGPSAARLLVSSSTADADLFLVLRVFAPGGEEVVFQGAIDPHTPIGQGWLRASQRKLDPRLSRPWRPYHPHDEKEPLAPGEAVAVDVEIWPTSIVVPPGYRIALSVRGRDYEYAGESGGRLSTFKNEMRGCGPFLHDEPRDRPPELFAGEVRVHSTPQEPAYLLLPVIPPQRKAGP
jgi:uncharacterized protein